jgi:transcriptional regulator with PAS, ATPase and Fis domain
MASRQVEVCGVEELVGETPCMRELREQIAAAARHDVTVLLQGESGTGKEVVSRAIHRLSSRRSEPFVAVNCAAMSETLLESQLFGHEAGAFTGAQKATLGFLRAADGGTILLDEVGDMGQALQSKLLRALEERAVVPVGGTQPIPLDIRVIAATHRDLGQAVQDGAFREDLYYRLNVIRLFLPPLRERKADVPLLCNRLSEQIARSLAIPPRKLLPEALAAATQHDWPGNVRELGNVIQRAYVLGKGPVITLEDLLSAIQNASPRATPASFLTLQEAARSHILRALEVSGGVRGHAAKLLGVDRKSLWRMLRRYGIASHDRPDVSPAAFPAARSACG